MSDQGPSSEVELTKAGLLGLNWAIGPAVRAFGRNFGLWTDYQTQNLFKLSKKVEQRLGGEAPNNDQSVHPRVARDVLAEASWISDNVHQEYLVGLLLGARSPGGRSERGVQFVQLLGGMTSNQIRLHHALYAAFLATHSDIDPGEQDRRQEAQIWLPLRRFEGIVEPEVGQSIDSCVVEISISLTQLDLLQPVAVGSVALFARLPVTVPEPYFAAQVTASGLALYLSAYGLAPWQDDAREQVRAHPLFGPRFEEFELRQNSQLIREVRHDTP